MRKPLALIVALVALLAGLLSGCANDPGTAARVGDVKVRAAQVDDATKDLQEFFHASAGEVRPVALSGLVKQQLRDRILEEKGLTISDADREPLLAQMKPEAVADPKVRPFVDAEIDLMILQQELGARGLQQVVDAIPVELNPLYGSWDGTTLQVAQTNEALAKAWKKQA